ETGPGRGTAEPAKSCVDSAGPHGYRASLLLYRQPLPGSPLSSLPGRAGGGADGPHALARGLDAGELFGQVLQRRGVVGGDEALLVQDLRTGVVHLEEELARAERLAGVLPGQPPANGALKR